MNKKCPEAILEKILLTQDLNKTCTSAVTVINGDTIESTMFKAMKIMLDSSQKLKKANMSFLFKQNITEILE